MDAKDQLRSFALEMGFLAEWSGIDLPAKAGQRFEKWIDENRNAEMDYLAKNTQTRTNPRSRFEWAESALVLGAPHFFGETPVPSDGLRLGKVARYAWTRDYHLALEPYLKKLEDFAQELGLESKAYVDHGPILERVFAGQSGLGWQGKNTMLMQTDFGSFMTLAVLLTNVRVEPSAVHPNRCGKCIACNLACPTGALDSSGLDARKCISYWTIENRGPIPIEMWKPIGEWLFGCDICQDVCPWNERAQRKGAVPWQSFLAEPSLAHPDFLDFFQLSGKQFEKKYQGSAFLRAGRARMARNAIVVLANRVNADGFQHRWLIEKALEDINPLVRETAQTALEQIR